MRPVGWLVLAALVLGFAIGWSYAWIVSPARPADTSPSTLRPDFKEQFRLVIASAYAASGNLDRARARLALLGDADPVSALAAQAQRSLAAGEPVERARDLANLAGDLKAGVSSVLPRGPSEGVNANTASTATLGPLGATGTALSPGTAAPDQVQSQATASITGASPSATITSIPPGPYELVAQDQVCSPTLTPGLLQVVVADSSDRPMPGVEITITWDGGEEHFFTGLKPEIGPGYADYTMQPATAYALSVGQLGSPISSLEAPECGEPGRGYVGGLKLSFRQP
jgi:hypothetical protein